MHLRKLAVALSAMALCLALLPAYAHAATLTTGAAESGMQSNPSSIEAASTKTVYILTKATVEGVAERTITFKYNKSNLISSAKTNTTSFKFSYNKKNQLTKTTFKESDPNDSYTMTWKYTLDSKGNPTKGRSTVAVGSQTKVCDYKATYKKGKLKTLSARGYYKGASGSSASYQEKTNYSIKDGRITKEVRKVSGGESTTYTDKYTYDKKTNLTKWATDNQYGKSHYRDLNQYKNKSNKEGRLVNRTAIFSTAYSGGANTSTYKYTYKAVKVKNSLVSKVKAQQWALLNNNLNCACGLGVSSGFAGILI